MIYYSKNHNFNKTDKDLLRRKILVIEMFFKKYNHPDL